MCPKCLYGRFVDYEILVKMVSVPAVSIMATLRQFTSEAFCGRLCLVMVVSALVVPMQGCGDGLPDRVPVSGIVMIDGVPLADCALLFVPMTGRASRGRTNDEGRFTLNCYDKNDGALRGTHRVAAMAAEEINGNTIEWNAPKKYASHSTSGLTFAIDEPVDDLKVELTWDGGKPFIERNGGVDEGGD